MFVKIKFLLGSFMVTMFVLRNIQISPLTEDTAKKYLHRNIGLYLNFMVIHKYFMNTLNKFLHLSSILTKNVWRRSFLFFGSRYGPSIGSGTKLSCHIGRRLMGSNISRKSSIHLHTHIDLCFFFFTWHN